MRGISSMFGAKRSDLPLATPGPSINDLQPPSASVSIKKPSRIFGSLSRKTAINTRLTPFGCTKEQAQSSSSSSSGSNSLRTPLDDEGLVRNNSKVAWMPWLGRKKSDIAQKPSVHHEQWELPRQEWQSRPPPVLRPPPSRGPPPDETEDESSSESEDESEVASDLAALTVTPLTLEKCRTNLCTMITSSLQPPFSPPPVLHVVGQPIFPRSCNAHRSLYKQETMETRMHKVRILKRLDRQQVTRGEELSIISFGMRSITTSQRPSLQLDDEAVPDTFQLRTYSQGLQRWALRPCFEDRMAVWTVGEGTRNVLRTRITGTSFGVAALEISEALDVLAGAIAEEADLESPSTNTNSSSLFPAAAQQGRNAPSLPSPLRMEHGPPPMPSIYFSSAPESDPRTMPPVPTVKRGVRFAEDDKEDQIPLSYVLRIKKKREDKAKFLQEEKERRAFEEERARHEEERLRREAERQEWEKERKAWEKERRAMEEERRQRQYAEEVAAARIRREASRSGFYIPPPSETSSSQQRQVKPSRSTLDIPRISRRQTSEPAIPTGGSASPYTDSPTSSNPPSANGGSPSASGFFSSRPPSINSANTTLSSAEDLQQHRKNASKRSFSGSDHRQVGDRTSQSYYPAWSSSYLMPPVTPMPSYHMNMPLLPPTPPFMMEQNRRSHSPNSRPNSHSSSSRQKPSGSPSNSSTERLSPSQRSHTSLPRPEMQHHRRGSSDDALRDVQRPSLPDRRSGSAAEFYNRRSNTQLSQQSHPPIASRSQTMWASSPLPHDSRGRDPSNRRQSVID